MSWSPCPDPTLAVPATIDAIEVLIVPRAVDLSGLEVRHALPRPANRPGRVSYLPGRPLKLIWHGRCAIVLQPKVVKVTRSPSSLALLADLQGSELNTGAGASTPTPHAPAKVRIAAAEAPVSFAA
jgi:hypothetical protein